MSKSQKRGTLPLPGEGKRGEEGYLGYLLRQAATAHRARAERALADIDVTPPQFLVLTMLDAYPGHSNADLARLTLLTPQTVNVIVTNLDKAGAITRAPHPVHGRIQQIALTPHGRELLVKARTRMHRLEKELTQGLSSSDEKAVRHWLVRLASDLPEG